MMKRNNWFVLGIVFILSVIGWNLLGQKGEPEMKFQSESKKNKEKDTNWNSSSTPDKDSLLGKSDIPFDRYEQVYQESDIKTVSDFDDYDCQEKVQGKELAYAYVDFIFLKKSDDAKLTPIKTASFRFENIDPKQKLEECDVPQKLVINNSLPKGRARFTIYKYCNCLLVGSLRPGGIYKFNAIENIGWVSHKFQIPPEEKLDFVSPDSKRKPEPYPYPILVSDIEKPKRTEQKERETPKLKTITFQNVGNKILNEWKLTPDYIYYRTPNDFQSKEFDWEKTEKGYALEKKEFTFELRPGKNGKVTGGTLSVYGKKMFVPEGKEESARTRNFKQYLAQYIAKVSSSTVDLSEGLDYQYNPDKTVQKIISLDRYDIKLKGKYDDRTIQLRKDLGGLKPAPIYSSLPFKEDGTIKVLIDAPPGDYELYFDSKAGVIDSNFHWPPK